MKKLLFYSAAILMVLSCTTSQAQDTKKSSQNSAMNNVKSETKTGKTTIRKVDNSLVSELSKNAFYADFGKAPDQGWGKDHEFDIALFTKDGKNYEAYYDQKSKLVGTTTLKTFADLPKKSQEEIKKDYKDYVIDKVVFFKDNELNEHDMVLYGVDFNDSDSYFIEMSNKTKNIVLQTNSEGGLTIFNETKKVN